MPMCCPGFCQRVGTGTCDVGVGHNPGEGGSNLRHPYHRGYACGLFTFLFKLGVVVFAY